MFLIEFKEKISRYYCDTLVTNFLENQVGTIDCSHSIPGVLMGWAEPKKVSPWVIEP